MEDISDVEFGSDKESEEAPILVAQRYLNIFRQVHIFKKEMRDKFDDELLALPTNVTDFFKKMPGGRLLVEHIEDVKTERGISFVKANREDFTNGTETVADTTSNVTSNVVGGNVVMDASFAETFAKSMADAFKNIPALSANDHPVVSSDQPIVSEYPIDLDKAFEPIVEEIKTLHSSVLNMLNETRSIADNVITSQISISRMLEDSLNSPVQQENILLDDAILKKTEKFISADELDETLSQFKNQLQINFNQSLDEIKSLINTYMEQQTKLQMLPLPKENKEPYPSLSEDISVSDIDASLSDIPVVDASLSDIPMVDEPVSDIPVVGDSELLLDDDLPVSEQLAAVIDEKISDNNDKKKKKKKKKKSKNLGDVETDAISTEALINGDDTYTDIPDDDSVVQGVIHNDFYKHDDDFSYINLDEPPLDTDDSSLADLSTTMLDDLSSIETSNNSEEFNSNAISDGNKSFDDDLAFSLPEQGSGLLDNSNEINSDEAEYTQTNENLDIFNDDGLNFALPQHNNEDNDASVEKEVSLKENLNDTLDDLVNNDSILSDPTGVHVESDTSVDFSEDNMNLDDFVSDNEEVAEDNTNQSLEDDLSDDLLSKETMPKNIDDNLNLDDFQTTKKADADLDNSHTNRYREELDKIRQALTSDDIDIASLDTPIALDDYGDNENFDEDFSTDINNSQQNNTNEKIQLNDNLEQDFDNSETSSDADWEWEYVDENGNIATVSDDNNQDWEWEYVEDDDNDSPSTNNNKKQ